MTPSQSTCWTMIRGAAAGSEADRSAFARCYADVIRAYLGARWNHGPLAAEVADALQDVFVECFKADGALGAASPITSGRFRTYLYAVVRNVARRVEERAIRSARVPAAGSPDLGAIEAREEPLSRVFERGWALMLVRRAGELHAQRARAEGPGGERRVEVLELRFRSQIPIREIALRWSEDAAQVHRLYARAREEFRRALIDVVRDEEGSTEAEAQAECARLLAALG